MELSNQLPVEHKNLPVLIPIILADSCDLDRWPRSRISRPIQFQRKSSGTSPFEEVLSQLSNIKNLLPPIISLSSHCIRPALEQLASNKLQDSATLLVAPLDRGSLHCAITAALLAHRTHKNALMVVIDCTKPPTSWETFDRLLSQVQQTPLSEDAIIVCGHPVGSGETSHSLVERIEQTSNSNFFTCKPAAQSSSTTTFELGSALFSSPHTFLKHVSRLYPQAYSNCNKALQSATQDTGSIWPNFNIWSCLENRNLLQTLAQDCEHILLRPIESHDRPVHDDISSDLIFTEETENCCIKADGHLIAVAGCDNLRIVSTKDATLIVNKDKPESISPILGRMRSQERPEIYDLPITYHSWGTETEIERHPAYIITRIEVDPSQSCRRNPHAGGVEFLHILTGKGEASISETLYPLAPGLSLTVPAKAHHTVRNMSENKLVILKTKHVITEQLHRHSAGMSASSPP